MAISPKLRDATVAGDVTRSLRRTAIAVIAASGIVLIVYFAAWAAVDRRSIGRADFTSTYMGALLLRDGHRADLYDPHVQAPVHAALIAPDTEGNLPFVNPPTAAALALPLTALGLDTAWRVFGLLQLALLAAAVILASRPVRADTTRPAAALAGLAGVGTLPLLLLGQWDGLLALGLAVTWRLARSGRDLPAGLVLGLTAAVSKPHLFLGVALFVLATRRWRLVAGALLGTAACALADLALVGPGGLGGLVDADRADAGLWPLPSLLGANGLAGSWLSGTAAVITGDVLAAAALAAALALGLSASGRSLQPYAVGGATALSLLASPHLLAHDLVLLAPVAWSLDAVPALLRRFPGVPLGWLALTVVGFLDLGAQAAAPPGRLVPIVLAVLGCAATAVALRTRGPQSQAAAA